MLGPMGRQRSWRTWSVAVGVVLTGCSGGGPSESTDRAATETGGVEYTVTNRCGFASDLFVMILDSDPVDPAESRPIGLGNGDRHVYRTRDVEPTARFVVDLVDPTAAMSGAAVETDEDGIPVVVDAGSTDIVLGPDRGCPGIP